MEIANDLPVVRADAGQLLQAFVNLLRFLDIRGHPVTVRVHLEALPELLSLAAPGGSHVFIDFESPEPMSSAGHDVSRIFDPFYSTREDPVGLAMPAVHSIIHAHGGHIRVDADAGTRFSIVLPAAEVTDALPETSPEAKPARTRRYLVMDDDGTIADIVRTVMTARGHEVVSAYDGAAAVDRYAEAIRTGRPFAAVLLDLHVAGGMGGREALQKIRLLDPAVRAIATSGYSEDPILADPHANGFVAGLPKPYDLDQMVGVLEATGG